jgi:hypothetical protein
MPIVHQEMTRLPLGDNSMTSHWITKKVWPVCRTGLCPLDSLLGRGGARMPR